MPSSTTTDPADSVRVQADAELVAARQRAGEALRAAREAAGRELPQLAAQLKVAAGKLQALEDGDWSRLPDVTFARALLRSACKALRIDAAPLLGMLVESSRTGPEAVVDAMVDSPMTRSMDDLPHRSLPRSGSGGGRNRVWRWLAFLILLAAAAVYFWPAVRGLISRDLSAEQTPVAVESAAKSVESVVSEPAVVPAASAAASPASAPAASAPSVSAASAAAAASAPVVAASKPHVQQAAAAAGTLAISATAQSWVRVAGHDGKVLFSQVVEPGAGQSVVVPAGSTPLSVVVGNAPQTTLVFDGKPVNLGESTRGNVARLTLP